MDNKCCKKCTHKTVCKLKEIYNEKIGYIKNCIKETFLEDDETILFLICKHRDVGIEVVNYAVNEILEEK